jgi:N-acyl homoserine lactone hydrolase
MRPWIIRVLYGGYIEVRKESTTPGLDIGLSLQAPYLSFLLSNEKRNILLDCGINKNFIVDGMAWGCPAVGGEKYILKGLEEYGLSPDDIDIVVYSHLHNDHAGNCHLFRKAIHIFQDIEWQQLLDPLPVVVVRADYDQSIIPVMRQLECIKISGDQEIDDGLRLFRTPGHTAGCQSVQASTENGKYLLIGDAAPTYMNLFSQATDWTTLDGKTIPIQPAPKEYGLFIAPTNVTNFHDWYASANKIRALAARNFILPGHEPSILGKKFG